jgi:hypothetical protein
MLHIQISLIDMIYHHPTPPHTLIIIFVAAVVKQQLALPPGKYTTSPVDKSLLLTSGIIRMRERRSQAPFEFLQAPFEFLQAPFEFLQAHKMLTF